MSLSVEPLQDSEMKVALVPVEINVGALGGVQSLEQLPASVMLSYRHRP